MASPNLDDTLLRIARELKTAETLFLARLFILQSSIISQILEFIYRTVSIFSFDHMTDENREYEQITFLCLTLTCNRKGKMLFLSAIFVTLENSCETVR